MIFHAEEGRSLRIISGTGHARLDTTSSSRRIARIYPVCPPVHPLTAARELRIRALVEARRQNIYETAAARYIQALPNVSAFRRLASHGSKARNVNSDGQILTGTQLAQASKPSKSLDFQWITGTFSCYAARKYPKEGGGTQDSQYNEMEKLLRNCQGRTNNEMAFFALVDGPYYAETKIRQPRSLARQLSPRSYVT